MRCFLLFALPLLPVAADTVVLKGGAEVHGTVRESDGKILVSGAGREWSFDKARVERILPGRSAAEEYAEQAAKLEESDAAGWYRLGLWARERGLAGADEAFARVLAADPDHRAARRELGYERVGEEWVARDEAMRRKGFVLADGRWMLPAEADTLLRSGAKGTATPEQMRRGNDLVLSLFDDDAQVREAAMQGLRELPGAALVHSLQKALYAPHEEARLFAARTLGNLRDRAALPALIRSSLYDASEKVRAHALRTVKGFGDPDVFYPYARTLFGDSRGLRLQAVKALGELGDPRGVDVILRRVSVGIGEGGRANIFVGKQQSYIQDFDVEIAQAAAIGDPIVSTIRDGVMLDYKVLGGYGEAWIIEERNTYAGVLSSLVGRDFGTDFKAYARYAEEQGFPRVTLR